MVLTSNPGSPAPKSEPTGSKPDSQKTAEKAVVPPREDR